MRAWASRQAEVEKTWRAEHGDLARKLDMFLSGSLPGNRLQVDRGEGRLATRAASAAVLGVFAETIENMIVASADLSNSDKTDGFLKKTKAFTKGDFSGKFFQAGVSELTMACVANGMALHGGDSCVRHVLRLLGLHETGSASFGADAPARDLYLDARLVPRW